MDERRVIDTIAYTSSALMSLPCSNSTKSDDRPTSREDTRKTENEEELNGRLVTSVLDGQRRYDYESHVSSESCREK
jgi:hypothetical protein